MVDFFLHFPTVLQAKLRLCFSHCINMEQRGLGRIREVYFRILQTF
jgi:hypothetical protein